MGLVPALCVLQVIVGLSHAGSMHSSVSFTVNDDLLAWGINFTFSKAVTSLSPDIATVASHSSDGLHWEIVNKEYLFFHPGSTMTVWYNAEYEGDGDPTVDSKLINLMHDNWKLQPAPTNDTSKYNYNDVLYKSILFYEAQRSGKLPANNRVPYRSDSALGDKGDNGEDLTGGWYDAGDHVKFNYPMSASVTMLAWGYLLWPDAYKAAGQEEYVIDGIKWPLDYLIKCHTGPEELYVQVGDGQADHNSWEAAEEMTMARPAYKITADKPGTDVAMETAAAMAAGYLIFKDRDATYAATLLNHSQQIYDFGLKYIGNYSQSVPAAAPFYGSGNLTGAIVWGSLWLYQATNDTKYLAEAEKRFDPDPGWAQSWGEKIAGSQLLLYKLTGKDIYKTAVDGNMATWLPGGTVDYTPKGLAWRIQWGSLRYASNMGMIALAAADAGINADKYRHWAMCQLHYALGDTGFSYVVGFGDKYPQNPAHRGSSCPDLPAPCGWGIFSMKESNIHILYGGLVGGPDKDDSYKDDRSDYVHNEVACDYNAGFQGAIAGLKSLWLRKLHPEQSGSATCPYTS